MQRRRQAGAAAKAARDDLRIEPSMMNTPSAAAMGARTGPPLVMARRAASVATPPTSATLSLCATPSRSPRFQLSAKPNGVRNVTASISVPALILKNGAPTVILAPVTCSSASG